MMLILTSYLGLTWLLVYRTENYQRLKGEVEKASKRRKLNVSLDMSYIPIF